MERKRGRPETFAWRLYPRTRIRIHGDASRERNGLHESVSLGAPGPASADAFRRRGVHDVHGAQSLLSQGERKGEEDVLLVHVLPEEKEDGTRTRRRDGPSQLESPSLPRA